MHICTNNKKEAALSLTQVEGLGYSKEEAIEVVQREVRCWINTILITDIITTVITIVSRSTQRRGQKGRGRRPPGFGGHHGSVAMVHGHGIHIR